MSAGPRIGSLCSGYGGLDAAVMEVLGGSVAWHCQWEPPDKDGKPDRHQYAARILAHHWPGVPNHGDITAVDWAAVEPVDVVTAGFPCTDLSYAGRGEGIKEGTRSGLWLTIAQALPVLRPRLLVLENVAAIVVRRPGLDVVLADLAESGFDAVWCCVRASDVGAPHRRERWFCLAWPSDTAGPGRERADEVGGRPARDGGCAPADPAHLGHERGRSARDGWPRLEDGSLAASHSQGDGWDQGRTEPAGQLWGSDAPLGGAPAAADTDREPVRQQPVADPGRDGETVPRLPGGSWGVYGPAIQRWEAALGRPAPGPVDDQGRLAPVFVEWMMGLPAGHVTAVPCPGMSAPGLRNAQLKALGNGVVPQQAAFALRLLLERASAGVAA